VINFALASESDGADLVVYAAGSLKSDKLDHLSIDDWMDVLNSNLVGAFLAARHSIGIMKPGGHMIFIGAYIDHIILPKMGVYSVAKAGLDPLVSVLQKENRNLRFSIVRPGSVDTDFWDNAPFKKPVDAKSPKIVAQAILEHHLTNSAGDLNL